MGCISMLDINPQRANNIYIVLLLTLLTVKWNYNIYQQKVALLKRQRIISFNKAVLLESLNSMTTKTDNYGYFTLEQFGFADKVTI